MALGVPQVPTAQVSPLSDPADLCALGRHLSLRNRDAIEDGEPPWGRRGLRRKDPSLKDR